MSCFRCFPIGKASFRRQVANHEDECKQVALEEELSPVVPSINRRASLGGDGLVFDDEATNTVMRRASIAHRRRASQTLHQLSLKELQKRPSIVASLTVREDSVAEYEVDSYEFEYSPTSAPLPCCSGPGPICVVYPRLSVQAMYPAAWRPRHAAHRLRHPAHRVWYPRALHWPSPSRVDHLCLRCVLVRPSDGEERR